MTEKVIDLLKLSEEEALEHIMIIENASRPEAKFILAIMKGDIEGGLRSSGQEEQDDSKEAVIFFVPTQANSG